MATLTSTTDTAENMHAALALGDSWKTPPTPAVEEVPAHDGDTIRLDKLPAKDYNEIRDAQEADKKEQGPEFLREQKPKQHVSRAQKAINKAHAKYFQQLTRADEAERERDEAERERDELRAQVAGNGLAANPPVASRDGEVDDANQPESPSELGVNRADAPSATPRAEQKQQYNREFDQAARSIGLDLAKANQIDVSPELRAAIYGVGGTDAARLVDFFTKNPQLLEEIDRWPGSISENIKTILSDLKAARGNGRTAPQTQAPTSNAVAQTPEQEKQHLGNSIRALGVDNWSDVLGHFENNPEIVPGLLTMNAEQARVRVKAIAAQLKANQKPPRERVQPPAPITPVGASSTVSGTPLENMPIKDFMKIRNKQERERKRNRI